MRNEPGSMLERAEAGTVRWMDGESLGGHKSIQEVDLPSKG